MKTLILFIFLIYSTKVNIPLPRRELEDRFVRRVTYCSLVILGPNLTFTFKFRQNPKMAQGVDMWLKCFSAAGQWWWEGGRCREFFPMERESKLWPNWRLGSRH